MPINRCIHGCYDPEGRGVSYFCSICSPRTLTEKEARALPRHTPSDLCCPECGAFEDEGFNFVNDYDFNCAVCGSQY